MVIASRVRWMRGVRRNELTPVHANASVGATVLPLCPSHAYVAGKLSRHKRSRAGALLLRPADSRALGHPFAS